MADAAGGSSGAESVPLVLSLQDLLRAGISLHQRDERDQAEQIYLRVLELEPRNPDALHFLGVLRNDQARYADGAELIEEALTIVPGYTDAWANLGNLYRHLDRLDDAETAYRRALELNAEHVGALNNLATLLRVRRNFEESLALHRRAIELAPRASNVYYNFANTVRQCGDPEIAIAAYRKAIELNPSHGDANHRFGYLLYRIGRKKEAIAIFRDWVANDPDNPVAAHLLAACTGEGVPDRASDQFIRKAFDDFADSFDSVLLETLDYRAPELVAEAIAAVRAPEGGLDVLDAGCGTGLCAAHLRPYARSLVGIDLSPRMLRRAFDRGGYDELHEAEITEFLRDHPASYELIASADTLVYFGALETVLAGAHAALRPGGLFVFTAERHDDDHENDYEIGAHGRYLHSERYLRRALVEAGFGEIATRRVVPRTEGGKDVDGFVVTARAFPHSSSIEEKSGEPPATA